MGLSPAAQGDKGKQRKCGGPQGTSCIRPTVRTAADCAVPGLGKATGVSLEWHRSARLTRTDLHMPFQRRLPGQQVMGRRVRHQPLRPPQCPASSARPWVPCARQTTRPTCTAVGWFMGHGSWCVPGAHRSCTPQSHLGRALPTNRHWDGNKSEKTSPERVLQATANTKKIQKCFSAHIPMGKVR